MHFSLPERYSRYGDARIFSALVVRKAGRLCRTRFRFNPDRNVMSDYVKWARHYGWDIVAVVRVNRFNCPDDPRLLPLIDIRG